MREQGMEFIGSISQKEKFVLLGIVLLGAALRFCGISSESLWLDEATSIEVASKSISGILGGDKFDHHTPPFYYLLLHYWLKLTSTSELALRSLSALLDCINIFFVFICARYHLGVKRGLVTCGLYSISSFAIYYAQEGRMYSLLTLLVLATYCYTLQLRTNRFTISSAIGFCLLATAGMYTHYYYALSLAGMTLVLLWHTKRDALQIGRWLASCVLVGIAFLPWIQVILGLVGSGGQSFREFFYSVLPYTLFRFGAGYAIFPFTMGVKDNFQLAITSNLLSIVVFLSVFGLSFLLGAADTFRSKDSKQQNLLGALFFPAIAAFIISFKLPMLSERYLVVSYPFFLIIIGSLFNSHGIRNLLFISVFSLSVGATSLHFFNPVFGKTQWKEAASFLESQPPDKLPIYVAPEYGQPVLAYYANRVDIKSPIRFPEELNQLPSEFWLVKRGTDSRETNLLIQNGYRLETHSTMLKENGLTVIRVKRNSQ